MRSGKELRVLGDLDFRSNGIGFLRLLFAVAVVWDHSNSLGGFTAGPITRLTHEGTHEGYLAVGGFFVLSGFLITRSFGGSGGILPFLWHRFLRIFPGFWVCLIVSAFVLAPLIFFAEHRTFHGLFNPSDGPIGFVANNWFLFVYQKTVGGPYFWLNQPYLLNGPLWTLRHEFACYLAVGVLGILGLLKRRILILIVCFELYISASALAWKIGLHSTMWVVPRLFEMFAFFACGAAAYLFRDVIPVRWSIAVAGTLLVLITLPTRAYEFALLPVFAYLTLFAAAKVPLKSFDRYIDLSYGVYLYAFPIQQLFATCRVNALGFSAYFLSSLGAAMIFAVGSWFLVERPSLSLKSRLFARPVSREIS